MGAARSTDEGDFHGFVGARWPDLVRTLVLIGCPAELAPGAAVDGLGRCRRSWDRTLEHDDPDVVAHRAVLGAWEERRREAWWAELRPSAESDWPAPDLSALDRMTPSVRTALVLRRYAGLDASQAAAVAGRKAAAELPASPDGTELRAIANGVPVLAPPDEQALAGPRPPWHRRRGVLIVAGLVVLALVVGAWTILATRSADPLQEDRAVVGLDPVDPQRLPNPAEVAWYADGVLHLANATYVLPTLRDLAVLGAGAVYGDDTGRVVYLADDGARTLLGTKDPVVPFATSDQLGWVAWVDPAGANPRLLVYDIGPGEIVGELDLPASRSGPQEEPDTRPVAIDQQTVYFVTAEGARAWRPTRDPGYVETLQPTRLLDVASANRVFQIGNAVILVDQPFLAEPVTMPGRGAELSDDGDHLLTHDPATGDVVVREVSSGDLVDVQPPEGVGVVDAVLAPEGAVTYLTIDPDGFASQEGSDSNPIQGELVTCGLDDGACEALATLVLNSEAPILAR
jgi:hypothetical protein